MATNNQYSFQGMADFINHNFGLLFLIILFFVAGFFGGSLRAENKIMRGGQAPTKQTTGADQDQPSPTADEKQKPNTLSQMPEVDGDDHLRGAENPRIYLVEYSDYECPYCSRFHPTMQQVLEEYGDQVAWVYRHYPLSFHPNAQPAAEAAECIAEANDEDAFWSFTDAIFEENEKLGGKLNSDAIETAIVASGADLASTQKCMDAGEKRNEITEEMQGGSAAGISGTPGTILVTADKEYKLISGSLPYAQVKQIIEQYL